MPLKLLSIKHKGGVWVSPCKSAVSGRLYLEFLKSRSLRHYSSEPHFPQRLLPRGPRLWSGTETPRGADGRVLQSLAWGGVCLSSVSYSPRGSAVDKPSPCTGRTCPSPDSSTAQLTLDTDGKTRTRSRAPHPLTGLPGEALGSCTTFRGNAH